MESSPVERLVEELSREYRVRRLLAGAARLAIACGTVVACVAIAVPDQWTAALWIALALLATWATARALSLRLDAVEADRRLGLRGALRTWFDARRTGSGGAMLGWLERDLAERIEDAPLQARRHVGRRRLGAARSALFLLLILVLLRWFVLPPLPEGIAPFAGLPTSVGVAAGGGEAQGTEDPGTEDEQESDEQGEEDVRPDTPHPDEGPNPEDVPPKGPELPPEALVFDPPVQDAFVVPSFVGAGEGRETTAPAAGIDEGAPSTAGAGATGGGTGAGRETPGTDPQVEFERALEDALRSRHVPPEEREFVRRWFRSLLEGGK